MKQVFADTFFFFALLNNRDEAHSRALEFSRGFYGEIVTTSWVIMELADGMAGTVFLRRSFLQFWNSIRSSSSFKLIPFSQRLFEEGLQLFEQRQDKEWTLTDCISFAVMSELRLQDALTGDKHFEQAGFSCLLK